MVSSSKAVPPRPKYESDGSGNDVSPPKEHRAAPPKENESARPAITAIRIPADGSLPYLTTLQLVKATSRYHINLQDSSLLHYSNADMREVDRHSSKFLDPIADDVQIDIHQLYHSRASLAEKATYTLRELENYHNLNAHSYGNGNGTFLDVPLAKKTDDPHLTFTHASLRLQPDVVDPFWRSGEAWSYRAFKRLYATPREGADLEMMTGEYHIMYTHVVGKGLRPNNWASNRISGDVFVLKMASGKNKEGDWYYENMPQEILHCSLGNQCLETLRSIRPTTWEIMVGERGNGRPGFISSGTGLKGMVARVPVA
ncbi:MAG: hypothetical protein ASARMPRED_003959 [Alectoria sarmentosa]|nr:MAG: hypothetical protein ASARMPRED_003959 [Alectoria sarmentosa]